MIVAHNGWDPVYPDLFRIDVASRDGLTLIPHLTVPSGRCDEDALRPHAGPLPLALLMHGGPWSRDCFRFDPMHRWLANRRYAMLAGMARNSDLYACGIDIRDPSDLETLMANAPAYWGPFMLFVEKAIGDPKTKAGRALMRERSPIHQADHLVKPLMVVQGAHDVRVTPVESERIVAALRENGTPAEYLSFPDVGRSDRRTAGIHDRVRGGGQNVPAAACATRPCQAARPCPREIRADSDSSISIRPPPRTHGRSRASGRDAAFAPTAPARPCGRSRHLPDADGKPKRGLIDLSFSNRQTL